MMLPFRRVEPALPQPNPPEPEPRAHLADAIQRRDATQRHLAATNAALARAEEALQQAYRGLDRAEEALQQAPEQRVAHMLAEARGDAPEERPHSTAELNRAVEAAQSDLDAAKETKALLEKEAADAASSLAYYERATQSYAGAVLAETPQVSALIAEARSLRRKLVQVRDLLIVIDRFGGALQGGGRTQLNAFTTSIANHLDMQPEIWGYENVRKNGIAAPWAEAFAALLQDADAPITIATPQS